jgi:hypothetical protein
MIYVPKYSSIRANTTELSRRLSVVVAGGGHGLSVGARRHPLHVVGVAGEGGGAGGTGSVGDVPQAGGVDAAGGPYIPLSDPLGPRRDRSASYGD